MVARTACERNRLVYDSAAVAEVYATSFVRMGLLDAEKVILARLGDRITGKAVLDLGVGGGRTAPHLGALAGRYLGVDYADAMVQRSQVQFPGLDFRVGDARRLDGIGGDEFDVVWFSFNGIDYVDPDGRTLILQEARRILRPGGTFVFSSHNVRSRRWRPRPLPALVFDRHPGRLVLRNLAVFRKHLASHYHYRRNKRREIHGDGFALRVDQAHEYRLLTYHVLPRYQVDQLTSLGFIEVEVLGADGRPCAPEGDPADAWLYYLARKADRSGELLQPGASCTVELAPDAQVVC
jgi:SAM-dependent methyltransferase